MLGGFGGRRKRRRQKMRWLDGITDSMDMSQWTLGVGDEQGGLACCNSWGAKCWTGLSYWTELYVWMSVHFYFDNQGNSDFHIWFMCYETETTHNKEPRFVTELQNRNTSTQNSLGILEKNVDFSRSRKIATQTSCLSVSYVLEKPSILNDCGCLATDLCQTLLWHHRL